MNQNTIVECPACGKRIRPAARKAPHETTAECRARVVQLEYEALGWEQCLNYTQAEILRESDVPVEEDLGGYHIQECAKVDETGAVEDRWAEQRLHFCSFAPASAVRAIGLLSRLRMSPFARRQVIRAIWADPSAVEALDSFRRLNRSITQSEMMEFVHAWATKEDDPRKSMHMGNQISISKLALKKLLRLARATAENLEADKHSSERHLVEVQLLAHVEKLEAEIESGPKAT